MLRKHKLFYVCSCVCFDRLFLTNIHQGHSSYVTPNWTIKKRKHLLIYNIVRVFRKLTEQSIITSGVK